MYTATGCLAKEDYVKKYAPLVKRIAYHMVAKLPPSVDVDDLIQAGMLGLIDAANRYQDNQGAQFETYATQRIRGAMLDELRDADWMPRSVRKQLRELEATITRLEQRNKRPATEIELAKELGLSMQEYHAMLGEARGYQLVHYDGFDSDEDDSFLDRHTSDAGPDPLASLMEGSRRQALVQAIEVLPERERMLMGLYYEQELNLAEIGELLGVTESRVCQLHSQAIARLRAKLKEA
jgi:RNA polymerase sigma factor for flagellar operon FliA